MEIIKYSNILTTEEAVEKNEPLMAVISFDGEKAYVAHADEAVEHHILLRKVGFTGAEIDKYFRIVFDKDGADWTFICPADYRNIADKAKRVNEFYKDGFKAISNFLLEFGYPAKIDIPRRYRRHLDELKNL